MAITCHLQAADPKQAIPDVELELIASPQETNLFKGKPTGMWRFQGRVLKGRKDALQPGDGYLGPTIRLNRNERVRIHFLNELPEPSIIHWHGLIVPEQADGHPKDAIAPRRKYTYDFTVVNRAGIYPYHPHPHMHTGSQVYRGLAGAIIIHDPEEEAVGLPHGEQDLPIIIQDRRFDADNRLVYTESMMDMMM